MLRTETLRGSAPDAGADAPRWGRVATLAVGDLVIFLIFATQGRNTHGEVVSASTVIATAAPFIIGWFVAAPFLGGFGRRGSVASTTPGLLLQRAALSWLVAWFIALVLRFAVFHGGITPPFAIVALLFNGALLLIWRAALSFGLWRRQAV